MINPESIIETIYPDQPQLCDIILKHSRQVLHKALAILDLTQNVNLPINRNLIINGALLHDIGIGLCHAPSIHCHGAEPYIRHGILGAQLLRQFGKQHQLDLEAYARICERHTGAGLTQQNIINQQLPLPPQDFLPETYEEKLICLADKFFSKSANSHEKSLSTVRHSLTKFGEDTLARFDALCILFNLCEKSGNM